MLKIFRKKQKDINESEYFKEICDALKEIMPQELRNKELKGDTKIDTLGIDSIKYINLFISLEEIIGKELEDIVDSIDLASITTIDDIVNLVRELQKN